MTSAPYMEVVYINVWNTFIQTYNYTWLTLKYTGSLDVYVHDEGLILVRLQEVGDIDSKPY